MSLSCFYEASVTAFHAQENEHHFYYEVFRAASIDELIPK